ITNENDSGPGSLNDPKMGVNKYCDICQTCKRKDISCPTHMGKISLVTPICHPLYIRQIISILQCICPFCGKLIISPSTLDKKYGINMNTSAEIRLKLIADESSKLANQGYKHFTTTEEESCKIEGTGEIMPCQPNDIYIIT